MNAQPADGAPVATEQRRSELKRILIADDEHLIVSNLSDYLGGLGFEVVGPCADGEAAVQLALEEHPDMCLLDIRMPRLDGLAAARRIWNELGTPVVIISAFSDPDDVDQCADIGVFGYLLKPIDRDGLRVAVSVAWKRWQDVREQSTRVHQLEKNLQNRRTVEQAKWRLVSESGIDEPEAHRRLQAAARNQRTPLVEIAQKVIDGELATGQLIPSSS